MVNKVETNFKIQVDDWVPDIPEANARISEQPLIQQELLQSLKFSLTPQLISRKLDRREFRSQGININAEGNQYLGIHNQASGSDKNKLDMSLRSSSLKKQFDYKGIMENTIQQANYLFQQEGVGNRRSTLSKHGGSPTRNRISGTPDIQIQKSPNLLSKNIGNLESVSSLVRFSPNLAASRILDDRRKSRLVMMPNIKSLYHRKQEGQSHDEFIRRFQDINSQIKEQTQMLQHQFKSKQSTERNIINEETPNDKSGRNQSWKYQEMIFPQQEITEEITSPLVEKVQTQIRILEEIKQEGDKDTKIFFNEPIVISPSAGQRQVQKNDSKIERFRPSAINMNKLKEEVKEEEEDLTLQIKPSGTLKVNENKKDLLAVGHANDFLALPGRKTNNMQIHSPIKLGRSLLKIEHIKPPEDINAQRQSSNELIQKYMEQQLSKRETINQQNTKTKAEEEKKLQESTFSKQKKAQNQNDSVRSIKIEKAIEEEKKIASIVKDNKRHDEIDDLTKSRHKSLKKNESDEVLNRNINDNRKVLSNQQKKFETSKNLSIYKSDLQSQANINNLIDKAKKLSINKGFLRSPYQSERNAQNARLTQKHFQSPIKTSQYDVNIDEDKPKEESFRGYFTINRRNKKGSAIYANKQIFDELLLQFLVYISLEKVISFSIPNAFLTDAGATILFQYLEDQHSLNSIKVYNNIMAYMNEKKHDKEPLPFLLSGTLHLAKTLLNKVHLQTLEIHGFFLSSEHLEDMFQNLQTCHQLRKLSFSNTNIQDFGVQFIAQLIKNPKIKLEHLTLYNNNLCDDGAMMLADAFQDHEYIKVINLQMNFIRDLGASYFVDGIRENSYKNIQKIILMENQCSERIKRFVKNNAPLVMVQTPSLNLTLQSYFFKLSQSIKLKLYIKLSIIKIIIFVNLQRVHCN
ncbi:UNKNOWN [Stylonychia lemnae]|uniref:Leucine Rich Repeat family protein n=1 Tax=Stylonychia lemnae TaxID=5949 RepID=A0A078A630_STYLE|nr:UNKNOWN [Stylonychia lemnae]|eukprot:CDW77705.1 UNKNOWN [Stylonychia lemnae]